MFGLSELQIKLAIGLFIGVLALSVVWSYNHAIKRAEAAEAEAKAANALISQLQESIKKNDQVLKERQINEDKLRAETAKFRLSFNQLKSSDPSVNQWANTAIPTGVLNRLRGTTDK